MFEEFEKIENIQLKFFSTMKVGGKAEVIVFPKNVEELKKILKIIKKNKKKYIILGNGSNLLFSDSGFNGVVISLKKFNQVEFFGSYVRVGAGVNLFTLNLKLQQRGLSGLEWSYGIPASVGGFVVMNGGCFGGEIGQFVEEVEVIKDNKVVILKQNDLQFSYRNSNIKEEKMIVLNVKLMLSFLKSEEILEKMQFFYQKKRESQPCELPSLGSVFKLVHGEEIIYPAKIIDNMGLKGVKIGGAEVSTKHAGFIVNSGGAISEDILNLVEFLEEKLATVGVKVEREIIVVD